MCGPSSQEKNAFNTQQTINTQQYQNFKTLSDQAASIFGSSSQIFKDLTSAFEPILSAGPGQSGFSPSELANLRSQAITQTGNAYRNASQAAGERAAAAGGGNALLPSGSTAQMQANIAQAGAGATAGELSNINLQNAQVGRQNWLQAASVLGGAPGVFGAATSAGGLLAGSGNSAMQGAEQVFNNAQTVQNQNNWWMKPVAGALGGALSFIPGVGPLLGSAVSGMGGASPAFGPSAGTGGGGGVDLSGVSMNPVPGSGLGSMGALGF
jgi:hypothetical protein